MWAVCVLTAYCYTSLRFHLRLVCVPWVFSVLVVYNYKDHHTCLCLNQTKDKELG